MWAASQELDRDTRQKAEDAAKGAKRYTLSPAAIKRRLAAKKAAAREAKKAKTDG